VRLSSFSPIYLGTSLPNYVASKVAAENGFGNQAVSNAFGSNTFNIMVGLGLPWVLYTSFGTGFEPYHGLPAEGILESIIILAVVLLLFVVLMIQSGFVLYKWHGSLFIGLYVAYIVLAIAQQYLF
jgi:Ca2+/Na+ antiporter